MTHDLEKLLAKLAAFCAYRERCTSEVVAKMAEWQLPEPVQQQLLNCLRAEGYLNDERFAFAYAQGKFRHNQWGKVKIRLMLRQKQIPEPAIRAALNSIAPEEYMQLLHTLATKKAMQLQHKTHQHKLQQRLFQFLATKGFEPDLVSDTVRQLIKDLQES
ncbi:MAG: regulatory protein RecX [Cytophagales bacterium]|nr:RecX family transcriptional regulator [Bernardetiaceae bacterium]MDW8205463.1 regulatory protein RecX [Cytophagales bacterium]